MSVPDREAVKNALAYLDNPHLSNTISPRSPLVAAARAWLGLGTTTVEDVTDITHPVEYEVSEPDREAVREALTNRHVVHRTAGQRALENDLILAAARAWLGLEDAIIIQRDENGLWPIDRVDAAAAWLEDKYGPGLWFTYIANVLDALSVEDDQ